MRLDPRTVARRLVVAVLVAAPIAIGGAHAVTLVVLALMALAAALAWVFDLRRSGRRPTVDLVLVLLAGVTAVTALQLVPLPLGILRLLSPAAAEIWTAPIDAGRRLGWGSLSIDPGATGLELVKLALYAAVYSTLVGMRMRGDLRRLADVVLGVAVFVAAIGLLRKAAGGGPILELYAPEQVGESDAVISTLVNSNHLAGFLALATLLGIGRAATASLLAARLSYGTASVFCGVTLALTLSRGGIAAFGVGLVLLALLLPPRASHSSPCWSCFRSGTSGSRASQASFGPSAPRPAIRRATRSSP